MQHVALAGLIALYVVSILLNINSVGLPRTPVSRRSATISTVIGGLIIAFLVSLW